MSQHSHWLQWKIDHGLAARGRIGAVPLKPIGFMANVFHCLHIVRCQTTETAGPQTFKQSVGGRLGPSGEVK